MKQTILRIVKDVGEGKNIIDYLLILAAVVLPLLNIFKLISTERIIWAILPTLGLLVAKTVSSTWRESEDVRIHENWTGEVYEAIAKARKSIVVLTSWVIDAPTLADKIFKACEKTNRKLQVDIYMLDPTRPFGAQRYGEIHNPQLLNNPDWYSSYEETLEYAVKVVRNRLQIDNIDLKFRVYETMPHVKICVIDDERFFFSWLPANQASTRNACVELSTKSANKDVPYAIDKLREHLAAIKNRSRIIELAELELRRLKKQATLTKELP